MDGEPPGIPNEKTQPPVTIQSLVRNSAERLIQTLHHEVGGKNVYYKPQDAVRDTLKTYKEQGLTYQEIFTQIAPDTLLTPHKLSLINESYAWMNEITSWQEMVKKAS